VSKNQKPVEDVKPVGGILGALRRGKEAGKSPDGINKPKANAAVLYKREAANRIKNALNSN
jgi:hypothetical protein